MENLLELLKTFKGINLEHFVAALVICGCNLQFCHMQLLFYTNIVNFFSENFSCLVSLTIAFTVANLSLSMREFM